MVIAAGDDRSPRGAAHLAQGRRQPGAARPFFDVAAVRDDDEVDAETHEQRREAAGHGVEGSDADRREPERQHQTGCQRHEGIGDQADAAKGDEEQDEHAEHRGRGVAEDVPRPGSPRPRPRSRRCRPERPPVAACLPWTAPAIASESRQPPAPPRRSAGDRTPPPAPAATGFGHHQQQSSIPESR